MNTKSLEEAGLKFLGIRKGCRWACDRPSNGQASDWTSFELLVVKDTKGQRLWCRNYYKEAWWGNNTFAPLPADTGAIPDEAIADKLAFWSQNELAALEQQTR